MPSIMIRHNQRRKQHFHSVLTHIFLTLIIAVVILPFVMSVGATTTVEVDTTTTTTKKVAKVATKPKIPTTPKKVVHPYQPKKANVAASLPIIANPNTPLLQQQQGRQEGIKVVENPIITTTRSSRRSKSMKGKGMKSTSKVISKGMKKSKSYYYYPNPTPPCDNSAYCQGSNCCYQPEPYCEICPYGSGPFYNPRPPPYPAVRCCPCSNLNQPCPYGNYGQNCCPGPQPGPEPPTNAPTTTNPTVPPVTGPPVPVSPIAPTNTPTTTRITFPPTFFPTITFPPSSTFEPTKTFKPSVTSEPTSS